MNLFKLSYQAGRKSSQPFTGSVGLGSGFLCVE